MAGARSFTVLIAFNKDQLVGLAFVVCCNARDVFSCAFRGISLTPHDLLSVAQAENSGLSSPAHKSLLLRELPKQCLGMN